MKLFRKGVSSDYIYFYFWVFVVFESKSICQQCLFGTIFTKSELFLLFPFSAKILIIKHKFLLWAGNSVPFRTIYTHYRTMKSGPERYGPERRGPEHHAIRCICLKRMLLFGSFLVLCRYRLWFFHRKGTKLIKHCDAKHSKGFFVSCEKGLFRKTCSQNTPNK